MKEDAWKERSEDIYKRAEDGCVVYPKERHNKKDKKRRMECKKNKEREESI